MIEANGYFGVVVPFRGLLVTGYLNSELDDMGRDVLSKIEGNNFYKEIEVTKYLPESDNILIGHLASQIVDGFRLHDVDTIILVSALSILIKKRFFWIESKNVGQGEWENSIGNMPVNTVNDARYFFENVSSVQIFRKIQTFMNNNVAENSDCVPIPSKEESKFRFH